MSRKRSLTEGTAFGIASFAVLALLGVGGGVVIARLYGIDVIGSFALAAVAAGICASVSTMQEQISMVRELAVLPARAPRITGLFAAVMLFSAGLTLLAGSVVAVIAAAVLAGPVGRPDLVVPALVLVGEYVLFTNTYWNVDMVFAAFRAGRPLFWLRLIHSVAYLAIAVALSWTLDSVWGLVVAQVAAAGLSTVLRLFAIRPYMRLWVARPVIRDGLRSFPDVLRFGTKAAPGAIADGLSHEVGTIVLGLTASVSAVGAWSRAWQLARRLIDPTYRIAEMLFPTLVERRSTGDHTGFDRALLDSSRLAFAALLLPAAVAGGAGEGVMGIFGPGFDQAADALAILLIIPPIYCTTTLLAQALLAADQPWMTSKLSVLRAALIIALGIPLALWLDVTGMAIAATGAYLVNLIAYVAAARPHLADGRRLPWPARALAGTVGAYAVGFVVARAGDQALDGLLGLTLAFAAGTIAYCAVFLLAGGLTRADRARVAGIRARRAQRPGSTPSTETS